VPTHSEKRVLPFRPDQLYDLVIDVETYPEFLPWCVASRILTRTEGELTAEVAIGFKGIRESFVSRVKHDRPALSIDVTYEHGPFRYLENHWRFEAVQEGCLLDFHVDFAFRSRLLEALIGKLFDEAVRRMVRAFETRAAVLYGRGGSG
jgi:coenzyme Q-binding protein COQ10